MSPTNLSMERSPRRAARWLALVFALVAGCGGMDSSSPDASVDALTACIPGAPSLTYTQLFTRYFADGTPGHCAKSGCHSGPDFNIWDCGTTKSSCYAGMVAQGLINTAMPLQSLIGDPKNSPLSWINPDGPMPFDQRGSFPEGRDAIQAWIRACAPNN